MGYWGGAAAAADQKGQAAPLLSWDSRPDGGDGRKNGGKLYSRRLLELSLEWARFFFLVILTFLGPLLWHVEVPRLGVESEL